MHTGLERSSPIGCMNLGSETHILPFSAPFMKAIYLFIEFYWIRIFPSVPCLALAFLHEPVGPSEQLLVAASSRHHDLAM